MKALLSLALAARNAHLRGVKSLTAVFLSHYDYPAKQCKPKAGKRLPKRTYECKPKHDTWAPSPPVREQSGLNKSIDKTEKLMDAGNVVAFAGLLCLAIHYRRAHPLD